MNEEKYLPELVIVVPCFNEEEVIAVTTERLNAVLDVLFQKRLASSNSRILYVDDGSRDSTWALIEELTAKYRTVAGIKLARNAGHQNALLAGLLHANSDVTISIDADLQDDEAIIIQMMEEYVNNDCEIVYGVRGERSSDTRFKKGSAELFYRFMRVMGVELIFNHADYRLMGRRALAALAQFEEVNLFLRGMVPLLGFKSTCLYYGRAARLAGESKYPLKRMLSLAVNGVTSFSITPLRFITGIGFVTFFISLVLSAWTLFAALFADTVVPGWASVVLPIYFLGGVQLLCIGIIGEYLGKLYKEVKRRPRYIIETELGRPGARAGSADIEELRLQQPL